MKTIKHIALRALALLLTISAATAFTACSSDDDPFFTAEETDAPRILNTNIPEWKDGQPQVLITQSRTTNFKFNIIATPRHYTTISWYLDGVLIHEGDSIDQPMLAGDHLLKIVATTTQGLSTSRTTRVVITPADGDPILGTKAKDLWVAPGATTTIHGCSNLDKVAKVLIGGKGYCRQCCRRQSDDHHAGRSVSRRLSYRCAGRRRTAVWLWHDQDHQRALSRQERDALGGQLQCHLGHALRRTQGRLHQPCPRRHPAESLCQWRRTGHRHHGLVEQPAHG